MGKSRETDYIHVSQWMWAQKGLGLKLGSIELMLFARIHGFSRSGAGIFYESQNNTAELFGITRESVNRALKALIDKKLIVKAGKYTPGSNKERQGYCTSVEAVNRAIAEFSTIEPSCDKMSHEQVEPSCDKTSHDPECGVTFCHTDNKGFNTTSTSHPIRTSSKPKRSDGWTDGEFNFSNQEQAVLEKIKAVSVNRNLLYAAAAPYAALLQRGIEAEVIGEAWDKHQKSLKDAGREECYFTNLSKWLASDASDGAAAICAKIVASNRDREDAQRRNLFEKLRKTDRAFESMVLTAQRAEYALQISNQGTELEVGNLWRACTEYFTEHVPELKVNAR